MSEANLIHAGVTIFLFLLFVGCVVKAMNPDKEQMVAGGNDFLPRRLCPGGGMDGMGCHMSSGHKHFKCSRCDAPLQVNTGICLRCRYLAGQS